MVPLFLFIFGLAIGSFLNVVSLRYDGNHFILDPGVIGGRSHCSFCGKTLRWFELIPLVSFLAQKGRCRRCAARLSMQYPIVEFISGLFFVLVPWRLSAFASVNPFPWLIAGLWIAAFLILLLASVVDIRTGIIPDELNIGLGMLAIILAIAVSASPGGGSFMGPLGDIFRIPGSVWVGRMIGAIFGFAFFEFLVLATRRKGIGMGDVKLALPLGFLFGWPDIVAVVGSAFVSGALIGVILIFLKKKTMQGTLPFGPFLACAAAFIFFFGASIAQWYVHLIGL